MAGLVGAHPGEHSLEGGAAGLGVAVPVEISGASHARNLPWPLLRRLQ